MTDQQESIEVHNCGTKVVIDYNKGRIGSIYPGQNEPTWGWSLLSDNKKYLVCRECGKQVTAERTAWAFWKHEKPVCDLNCYRTEELRRYACCPKAKQRNCVCAYSIECPDHGVRCCGTHD